jgi:outer membrane protein assembly factor BamB
MIARRAGLIIALGCAACDRPALDAPGVEVRVAAATIDSKDSMMAADAARTGWYSNQPTLDPVTVGSPYFGQLFDANLDGQIYAQPLYADGVVFVATETNRLYALDPATGATLWTRQLGTPWLPSDLNCADLLPSIGVTGTPAIDADSGTAYLLSKTYVSGTSGGAAWFAHAIDLTTGAERDGFPVAIAGAASNEPALSFDPTHQGQRPGLLLMNGVVYAGFGAHCDIAPYAGWIVGISTKGFLTTMWTTEAGPARSNGAGIWQSGGGLVSDGDGQILFATGNDWSSAPAPVPGREPPGALGESIVRLGVQSDGTLAATDFFSPAERATLNQQDADLGAGAPIALPAAFGTAAHPHLLAHVGKSAYLYLLDRDDLGGYQQGTGGGDRVLQRLGPSGSVWSKPSVWPGDGGYLYVPVVNACAPDIPAGCLRAYRAGAAADGTPMLSSVATSSSSFAYGSSAVVVTSDGTRSGSALLWTVWSSGWNGTGGELRAYDAVPVNGTLALRYLAGIGTSAKFTAPAVGQGRLYVGTRDGHVLGFGVRGTPPLRAAGAAFPPTLVGDDAFMTVQVTAAGAVNVLGLGIAGDYALTVAAPEVPFSAEAGSTFSLPIAFRPTSEGPSVGTLRITTDGGTFAIPLTGVGQSPVPKLEMSPEVVTFAPVVVGSISLQTVTITNVSSAAMTLSGVTPPASPFSVSGLPGSGALLNPGDSLIATITYAPAASGSSAAYLAVAAGEAVAAVAVEGSALAGGNLRVAPETLDSGTLTVGDVATAVFQLVNDGDIPIVIEKSKPPTSAAFQAVSPFSEGTVIAPGASLEQLVRVSPTLVGSNTDVWQLNANDGQGLRLLTMTVSGHARPATAPAAASATTSAAPQEVASSGPEETSEATDQNATVVGGCAVAGGVAPRSCHELAVLFAAVVLGRRRQRRRGVPGDGSDQSSLSS